MIFQPLINKLNFTLENWIKQESNRDEINKWLEGWERFLMKRVIQKVYKFLTQFI